MQPEEGASVPFSFFASLVRNVATIKPLTSNAKRARSAAGPKAALAYPAAETFGRWVAALRMQFSPLPEGTTAIIFRLLFPEDDVRRKYDIQEQRMTKLLADCFAMAPSQFEKWGLEEASGCLGAELKLVLQRSCPHSDGFISPISIAEVDVLLNELSALSAYTHASIRSAYPKGQRRTRAQIMRSLFRNLAPDDAAVLTQIILKDLRPLLYPLTEFHYTTALTRFNSAAVKMLTLQHAMDVWDPTRKFQQFYRLRAMVNEAAAFADRAGATYQDMKPVIGSPVAIPKSEKGLNCTHALDFLYGTDTVWAETKYDGERAQIHVEIRPDGSSHIMIFSKSKRDSTQDRYAVHHLVREALGLSGIPTAARVRQNVILDAEMVAFQGEKVTEFWHIRQLIEDTAHGIRGKRRSKQTVMYEHESMNSEENEGISLGLVFFDILYLDNKSLLGVPYNKRREILESHLHTEPGKTILAARYPIHMASPTKAEDTLRQTFAAHIAAHEEGLVLKAGDSYYNDYRQPWVKLKKDYIPGYGDSLDMVILGASWEKVRGRSLRVSPNAYTTFYVGALENQQEISRKNPPPPRFHVYFTVSYGLTRNELEELNFLIKSSNPVPYTSLFHRKCDLPFKVTFFDGIEPPTVVLRCPLAVELFGAGFTKAAKSQYYELRFPRIKKFHRPSERSWRDTVSLEKLHDVACLSVGREQASKEVNDTVKMMFGQPVSPGIHSNTKRKARLESAYTQLAKMEGVPPAVMDTDKVVREVWKSPCIEKVARERAAPLTPLGGRPLRPLASKTNVLHAEGNELQRAQEQVVPLKIMGGQALMVPPSSSPEKRPASERALDSRREVKRVKVMHSPLNRMLVTGPRTLSVATAPAMLPLPPAIEVAVPSLAPVSKPCAKATAIPPQSTAIPPQSTAIPPQSTAIPHANTSAIPLAPSVSVHSPPPLSPPSIRSPHTLVWFAKPGCGNTCAVYSACRASLVERPLHSVHALLAGCGWTAAALEVRHRLGVVVVEECGQGEEAWQYVEGVRALLKPRIRETGEKKRMPVVVYGCRSGLLARFE